jgi:hypothetical protein|tara:strand:+ start:301 stop:1740 length:1440 start_codon:yes stop_codon:yes gene_type:complete
VKYLKIRTISVLTILVIFFSCSPDATDPMDPKYGIPEEEAEEEVEEENEFTGDTFSINVSNRKVINPLIFGLNNDWRQIPSTRFTAFSQEYKNLGGTLLRFPGGWESEFYDWETNTTPTWDNKPEEPGADINTVKSNIENYSIVLPTAIAMNHELNSASFNEALIELEETAKTAITIAGVNEIGIVEIGNEWWLQYAGGVSRAEKLTKYTTVAMNIAEYISEEFPERNFKLLINGDYTKPSEFADMKEQFTKAYEEIDGVALHTYVGYQTDTHNMVDLQQRIGESADNFNPERNYIYLSEWMPSRDYNERRLYMEAANIIPDVFQIYAMAGTDAAAFWPPVNSSIPGVGVFNWNFSKTFPVGQIFSDLSNSFTGEVVSTSDGNFQITAALQDDQTLVVYVPGKDRDATDIKLVFEGFNVESIEVAEKFVPDDYTETAKAAPYRIETASASIDSENEVQFRINEEGSYQIIKLVFKGSIN